MDRLGEVEVDLENPAEVRPGAAGAEAAASSAAPPRRANLGEGPVAADAAGSLGAEPQESQAQPPVASPASGSLQNPALWSERSGVTSTFSGALPQPCPSSSSALHRAAWSVRSPWRWPQRPGELPEYVQRNFRAKTYGLLALQLSCVLATMVVVHWVIVGERDMEPRDFLIQADKGERTVFVALGLATVFLMFLLHIVQDWYPTNYILLALSTLAVGSFWGVAPTDVGGYLLFQVMGILIFASWFCCAWCACGPATHLSTYKLLLCMNATGWFVGALLDAAVMFIIQESEPLWVLVAVCLSFGFLMAIFVLDTGSLLVKANPDDFMRVVLIMNAALLVVSMPVFIASYCLLHALGTMFNNDRSRQQNRAQTPAPHPPQVQQLQLQRPHRQMQYLQPPQQQQPQPQQPQPRQGEGHPPLQREQARSEEVQPSPHQHDQHPPLPDMSALVWVQL